MTPEVILAIGTAVSATLGAIFGGRNSLNGFKSEVKASFRTLEDRTTRIETKVDDLRLSDALQEARLSRDEKRLDVLERAKRDEVDLVEEEAPR